jgi:hypothetical protein
MVTGGTDQQDGAVARHLLETGFGVRRSITWGPSLRCEPQPKERDDVALALIECIRAAE